MADINSALPIRSEADGADQRVQVKVVDSTAPGTAANQMQVSENLAHVREFGQDPAGVKRQKRLSENGETAIDGTYDGTSNTNPANIGMVVQERNAASADTRQTMKPTAVRGTTENTKVALDIALNDENGNAFSQKNPLPVSIEESEGVEVSDYDTSSSVAANANVNHEYIVTTGKVLILDGVWVSASGKIKAVLQIETAASSNTFNTYKVGFNSTANPNIDFPMRKTLLVTAGARVRIIITNKDLNAQDVYSTIEGIERPV